VFGHVHRRQQRPVVQAPEPHRPIAAARHQNTVAARQRGNARDKPAGPKLVPSQQPTKTETHARWPSPKASMTQARG
jgi:hypothetical protein